MTKAPLALIELLIMLFIFILAAGLCLRTFAAAHQCSLDNLERDAAVLQAQNAAEIFKSAKGDPLQAISFLGGHWEENCWIIHYDSDWNITESESHYSLYLHCQENSSAFLGQAQVSVLADDDTVLISFPLAWQEAIQ